MTYVIDRFFIGIGIVVGEKRGIFALPIEANGIETGKSNQRMGNENRRIIDEPSDKILKFIFFHLLKK